MAIDGASSGNLGRSPNEMAKAWIGGVAVEKTSALELPAALKEVKDLVDELDCSWKTFTAQSIEKLVTLFPNLKRLKAEDTKVDAKCFQKMLGWKLLENLDLERSKGVNDNGLKYLAELPALKVLRLKNCHITDSELKILATFPVLTDLNLENNSAVTDGGALFIPQFRALQSLNLGMTEITNKALEYISKSPSLVSLDLVECVSIDDKGLESLAKLVSLKRLNLHSRHRFSFTGLEHFQSKLPDCAIALH